VIVALFGAVLVQQGMARRFLWASLAVGAAVSFYVVRLGGDFMEWRFLTPASAVFYPAVVVAAGVVGERLAAAFRVPRAQWPLLACLHGGLVAALLAAVTRLGNPWAQTLSIPDQETIALLRRYTDAGRFDWRAAGALCDSLLPRDARIATTSAGIIPYLCDRHCLDLHGLTDPTIARGPVNGEGRGRMGHEHWLQDYGAVRERGVDVVVEWADPHVYPRAVAAKPHDGQELVSARLPDGRFIDFTVLNPALLPALRRDPRVVLYDPDKIADRASFHTVRDAMAAMIVDQLDWAVEASEVAHDFEEHQLATSPYQHSWHTKLLRYLPPFDNLQLEDDGRRIDGWAQWKVFNVSSASDLWLIARHDHTGAASYAVEVNGRRLAERLEAAGRPDEWWGEATLRIPRRVLVDGTNTIRITRRRTSEKDAEWYYMWFVQPAPERSPTSPAPPSNSAGGSATPGLGSSGENNDAG